MPNGVFSAFFTSPPTGQKSINAALIDIISYHTHYNYECCNLQYISLLSQLLSVTHLNQVKLHQEQHMKWFYSINSRLILREFEDTVLYWMMLRRMCVALLVMASCLWNNMGSLCWSLASPGWSSKREDVGPSVTVTGDKWGSRSVRAHCSYFFQKKKEKIFRDEEIHLI